MDDLISRSALVEKATNVTKYDEGGWDMDLKAVPVDEVLNAPAVDAVEVCRCKDCKHSYKGSPHGLMCECPVGGQNTSLLGGNDFCSCGERRDDDGN
jgi:hypothetical protein